MNLYEQHSDEEVFLLILSGCFWNYMWKANFLFVFLAANICIIKRVYYKVESDYHDKEVR